MQAQANKAHRHPVWLGVKSSKDKGVSPWRPSERERMSLPAKYAFMSIVHLLAGSYAASWNHRCCDNVVWMFLSICNSKTQSIPESRYDPTVPISTAQQTR